jgi:hypothetical protein
MTSNAPVETREFEQFIFETINCDCADEKFLEKTAPLVGKVVQKFNSLERELNSAICSMFSDDYDPMGLVVICGMTYSQKVNLLERLLKHDLRMMGKKDEWFDDLFLKLQRAGKLRNVVVHADWQSSEEDGNTPSSMKLKHGVLQQEFFNFTPKTLRDIIREIDKAKRLMEEFEDKTAKLMDCDERKGKRSV